MLRNPSDPSEKGHQRKPVVLVEVRGIEPRSVGTSVAASPSAADGEPSGGRTPSASDRPPYTRIDLDSPVRASRRAHPAKRRPLRRGQEPLRGTGYLSLGSQCKVWLGTYGCYRLFSEDSGDLGSLPTPLLPTSKPVHPQWEIVRAVYTHPVTSSRGGNAGYRVAKEERWITLGTAASWSGLPVASVF